MIHYTSGNSNHNFYHTSSKTQLPDIVLDLLVQLILQYQWTAMVTRMKLFNAVPISSFLQLWKVSLFESTHCALIDRCAKLMRQCSRSSFMQAYLAIIQVNACIVSHLSPQWCIRVVVRSTTPLTAGSRIIDRFNHCTNSSCFRCRLLGDFSIKIREAGRASSLIQPTQDRHGC